MFQTSISVVKSLYYFKFKQGDLMKKSKTIKYEIGQILTVVKKNKVHSFKLGEKVKVIFKDNHSYHVSNYPFKEINPKFYWLKEGELHLEENAEEEFCMCGHARHEHHYTQFPHYQICGGLSCVCIVITPFPKYDW